MRGHRTWCARGVAGLALLGVLLLTPAQAAASPLVTSSGLWLDTVVQWLGVGATWLGSSSSAATVSYADGESGSTLMGESGSTKGESGSTLMGESGSTKGESGSTLTGESGSTRLGF